MKPISRLLTLLLMVSALACWSEPVAASRLANVSGEAGETEKREDAEFVLSDHSQVEVQYKITKLDGDCSVKVRIHRKQEDGQWLFVKTILQTKKSVTGSRNLTLPAGDYKIEVVGRQSIYDVSVDM